MSNVSQERYEDALKMFTRAQQLPGVVLDEVQYSIAVRAAGRVRSWTSLLELLDDIAATTPYGAAAAHTALANLKFMRSLGGAGVYDQVHRRQVVLHTVPSGILSCYACCDTDAGEGGGPSGVDAAA